MRIEIDISRQNLKLFDGGDRVLMDVAVATAGNGTGQMVDSECTPLGRHVIRARIGDGCPVNTVFRGRRPTGELFTPQLREAFPGRDWILTRIMWLSGTQAGFNRLGRVDTMRRYIYIHGAPDDDAMGVPSSHGCIKMTNADVVRLFDRVETGVPVLIEA